MKERVQKILARRGVASRRKAEAWITAGRVTVNGRVCVLGDTADEGTDEILVDGAPLAPPMEQMYILLNKPRGYVSTCADEKGRRTVMQLIDCRQRVYPVGRLDMDSEGLLLLTNDGELTNKLLHPSHAVDKVYEVWLKQASQEKITALAQPMKIDGYPIRPAKVEHVLLDGDCGKLTITIHEGRNRQIRKMAEQSGMTVVRLRRIQEGPLSLGDLPSGRWRDLTPTEIAALQNL